MKLKHTPGPWFYDENYSKYEIYSLEHIICDLNGVDDAKIISAAPEMLEALIELYKELKENENNKKFTCHAIKILIEKATGMKIDEVLK
jgi:hypothetical protein